jgi:hypothetical protein
MGISVQPPFDLSPRGLDRLGLLEDAGVRDQPHEGQQTRPWQTDPLLTAQSPVQPMARLLVLPEATHMGVDQ